MKDKNNSQPTTDALEVPVDNELYMQLERECQAMALHAFSKGLTVPAQLMKALACETQVDRHEQRVDRLASVRGRLAEIVAPAKPETIMLMSQERQKGSMFLFLGSVPLIRKMMLVAIVSLIVLICLSLSPYINNTNMVASMFDMEGTELLYVQSILLASAAIGASFAALFKANSYVTCGSYDPKYESSYWVRFVVGLIAGIILTQLIPINLDAVAKAAGEAQGTGAKGGGGVSHAALRITMALVGGFSANLVYKILDRIVESVQSFIQPPVTEDPQLIKDALSNQFEREKQQFISELTIELNRIQQQLFAEEQPICQKKIQNLLSGYQLFITSNQKE